MGAEATCRVTFKGKSRTERRDWKPMCCSSAASASGCRSPSGRELFVDAHGREVYDSGITTWIRHAAAGAASFPG